MPPIRGGHAEPEQGGSLQTRPWLGGRRSGPHAPELPQPKHQDPSHHFGYEGVWGYSWSSTPKGAVLWAQLPPADQASIGTTLSLSRSSPHPPASEDRCPASSCWLQALRRPRTGSRSPQRLQASSSSPVPP